MNRTYPRIALIAVFGALAPVWWGWAVSNLTLGFFTIGGSPEHPTSTFAWATILGASVLLGLVVGLLLSILGRGFLLKGWLLFWLAFSLATVAAGLAFGVGGSVLLQTFRSPGNLTFLVATLFLPLATYVRACRS
jgi:lysylphosphatidylglycerol synthetase-like protein (DUF2156 family)